MDENAYDANQKLELFGHKIVRKCKGLPLAVKTLAGLLRDKRENNQWKAILENEIWDLRGNEILPSLMLSYYHLPPLLKRCFAYCALFPKDYVFSKLEMVLLWMAEGIVQPEGIKRLEDIAGEYFDELIMRSFFELSNCFQPLVVSRLFMDLSKESHRRPFFESSSNLRSGFVMHDLIHDLAQFVLGGIYCRKEYDRQSQVLTTTRHLSYVMDNYNVEATESGAMKSLHTLLTLNDLAGSPKHFFPTLKSQFQFLRVLRFRNCCNCKLPDSVGKLKHLRHLDLSFSDIVKLPDSIGRLYNLQALILTGCERLRQLPKDMSNLVNLRYLLLSAHWDFHKVSFGVGNLTSLQCLITNLAGPKQKLSQLCETPDNSNLESLGNNGAEAMVAKLHLPGLQLHKLTSLRWLQISVCENLKSLSKELYTLTSLRRLEIGSCPDLVSFQETRLPTSLQELKISNCENLGSLPKELHTLMSLKEFVIDNCPALVSFQETKLPTVLEELEIIDCENLKSLPRGLLHNLTSFQKLEIKQCPALEYISDMDLSTTLCEVSIINCGQLNSLPKGLNKLTNLKQLEIVGCAFLMECKNLEPLHTCGLLVSLSNLTIGGCHALLSVPNGLLPTNLKDLCIKDCPILESLSDGLSDLTSLKRLEIQNCPKLTQQYQKKEGEEWSKISQIPKVIIDGLWQ